MIADDEHDTARPDGFDPRYDPAFQRGYRPQPGERTRTRVRAASAGPATASTASRDRSRGLLGDPARPERAAEEVDPGRIAAPAPVPDLSAPSFPVAGAPAAAAAAPGATAPSGGLLAQAELSPRRNPVVLALWIIGAALVVVGVAVYAIAANASYTNNYSGTASDIGTQVFIQIGWVLAGPMITVGFATLVALLFLTALTSRRRAPEAAADPDSDPGEP